jgi:hypothetical protein
MNAASCFTSCIHPAEQSQSLEPCRTFLYKELSKSSEQRHDHGRTESLLAMAYTLDGLDN